MSDGLAPAAQFFAAMGADREREAGQASIELAAELKGAKLKTRLAQITAKLDLLQESVDQLQESVNQLLARKGPTK
jgi:uncharacterized protein YlxW (UPF0749 family)